MATLRLDLRRRSLIIAEEAQCMLCLEALALSHARSNRCAERESVDRLTFDCYRNLENRATGSMG